MRSTVNLDQSGGLARQVGALAPERHKQGFTCQLFCHALSHGVADNFLLYKHL